MFTEHCPELLLKLVGKGTDSLLSWEKAEPVLEKRMQGGQRYRDGSLVPGSSRT